MCEINHQSNSTCDKKREKNLFIKYKFLLPQDR